MSAATLPAPPATPHRLLTAEEYGALPDDGSRTELVRGVIIEMPSPQTAHGYYCAKITRILGNFVESADTGRVVSNDSGVVTERNPDTTRGPDVAFYSYDRVPRGPLPKGYWPAPELVVEVRSDFDRWRAVMAKALEYLQAEVRVVAVLDPAAGQLTVFTDDGTRVLAGDDEFTAPGVLPGFTVSVGNLLS